MFMRKFNEVGEYQALWVSAQISKVEERTNQGLHPLRYQNILDLPVLEWHIKKSLSQDKKDDIHKHPIKTQ
jgi:hypothetical protein